MDEDKKKLCDWITSMTVDEFYEFCDNLEDCYEFTGEQLFYSCEKCCEEHFEDCRFGVDDALCKQFFYEHYER